MPSNPVPIQPLTDAELESYRQGFSEPYDGHVVRLLDEVDRLRAENTAVKTQRDQFQKMMNSTVSAGVTIDGERLDALRERDALQGQLDKARKALFDDAFEGHAHRYRALAHALGVDQSEEGQTDA